MSATLKQCYSLLTVSDRVATGTYPDGSGDLIVQTMERHGWRLAVRRTVGDEFEAIKTCLRELCGASQTELVLTTGGTGLTPRDNTPQATTAVVEYEVPGIPEAMRVATASKTPQAMLSRATAGVYNQILIVNLPGSPKAVAETLTVVLPVLKHATQLAHGHQTWRHPE